MIRSLFALAMLVLFALPLAAIAAPPARVCERKPTHPHCQPDPDVTPAPTATSAPVDWTLIFADDFGVDIPEGQFVTPTSAWSAYPYPWPDTSGNGRYSPDIISVHDGALDMHLRQVNGEWLVAAPAPRAVGYRTSLRIEVRFRADPVAGFKTAWLLWPQSEVWPRDGEIDFPEGNLDGTISAFMHRQGATTGSDQDAFSTSVTYPEWHIAVTEWEAGVRCAFYLDGVLVGEVTERVPNTPQRMVLQSETWLSGGPPPAGASAHVNADWIVVWTR